MLRTTRRGLRRYALAPILRAATGIFAKLPWSVAQHVGAGLGAIAWRISGRDRRRTLEHLEIAFPALAEERRRQLARNCFRHLGISAGELLHLRGREPKEACKHVDVVGFEHVEQARDGKRPVLILTAHCGNWELLSTANLSHGLALRAIARELDDASMHNFSVDIREHFGSETIARGSRSSSRQLLRTLRSGGALALLIDQDIAGDSVFVPFFGRLANTPRAGADLALRLGAAVVPTFAERLDNGEHRVIFQPALELPDDPVTATAVMTEAIEAQIRRRPEQWVWMHKRWRRRPAD